MTEQPIEIIPVDASICLRSESRIRFGKTYPIEKNVKVKDIGQVHPSHLGKLLQYWSGMGRKSGEAQDYKKTQAGWSVPNDESNHNESNAQKTITRKWKTIQAGEDAGNKRKFLDTEEFLDEEELLDNGDVQDQAVDERPRSSASQSHTNEDNKPTKSANAETHSLNISTEFVPDATKEESPDITTNSNDTSGKVDDTELDTAVSRWLHDINYQLTGDLHSG